MWRRKLEAFLLGLFMDAKIAHDLGLLDQVTEQPTTMIVLSRQLKQPLKYDN